jgi:hypothetical protein
MLHLLVFHFRANFLIWSGNSFRQIRVNNDLRGDLWMRCLIAPASA